MVFVLHRYIFRELMRVFLLSALALTAIMSLGSILAPIQQYGVGPVQVLYLMVYFLPVTLTFVLPMAALFAASLVYGRFANDNELDACRAGGISLFTLVYPGFVLAVVVAIANLVLSFYVMPDFVHRAEKTVKADAKNILFRNIQRKGYYELPPDERYRIRADYTDPMNDILVGVLAVEVDGNRIKRIVAADKAKVDFTAHENFNRVQITAFDTYQTGFEGQGGFYVKSLSLSTEFGSLLGDNIKFKKIGEMKNIAADPMRFFPVAKLARTTYAQLITELLAEDISGRITDSNDAFYQLYSGDRLIKFTANQCSLGADRQLKLSGNVLIEESGLAEGRPLRIIRCSQATISVTGDGMSPTLTMDIFRPVWTDVNSRENLAHRIIIRGLIVPMNISGKFRTKTVMEVAEKQFVDSVLKARPSGVFRALQGNLQRKIKKTIAQITAELHSRLIFGIGCVPMIMIGIGLGIVLKGGHLLTAFGASTLPAAALIVFIMAGKNISKNLGSQVFSGIMLMWAGLIVLGFMVLCLYHKLLKN